MTYTPTVEQFLSQVDLPEDDTPTGDPLESIALSLAAIAVTFTQRADGEQEHAEAAERDARLQQGYDDLEDKHHVLYQLLEEIEAIIKPSTSKLANTVREAIGRWRAPQLETVPGTGEPEPATCPVQSREGLYCELPGDDDHEVHEANDGEAVRHWTTPKAKDEPPASVPLPRPANDAPVEMWRKYARDLGHDISDDANRSQIRTLLGLPHFES